MALNSTSVIRFVDLLCEGPIEGLVDGQAGVFLDETPIITGSSRNYASSDVTVDFRGGGRTQDQVREGSNGTSTVTNVSIEVGENYSETLNTNNEVTARDYGPGQVIRQITDTDIESFEILFSVPRLFSTAQEGLARGQLFNGTIRIIIDVQSQGSSYTTVYDRTITGIAVSDYQFKSPRIELPGTGPWNIRVRKPNLGENHFEVKYRNFETVEQNISLASSRGNRIFWTSLIEIQRVRTAYPYCAVAGLSLSTQQFSSLPTRAYKIRGKIVQIPNNATVRPDGSLSFFGTFDGQLNEAWTTCPVCCWYDMLTNPRYGAGDFVNASNTSWVDLYPLALYANQLVANPDGTQEPRFACNTVIGDQAEAFNVLQDLASVFRGMLFWQANTIQATADHGNLDGTVLAPVHLYNNSNVIGGIFNYSGTSLKTRSTSIRVRYNDPENFYKSNYVVVENSQLISKYGYQVREIVAIGATSKYQAQRLGRWMLASEELDGEVVSFSTGLQGAVVLPGQIFAVADEIRQGVRLAGRLSSATTTQITTDQQIALPSGSNHKLTCTLPDGTVESREILTFVGAVITVSSPFSAAPLAQSIWSISSSEVTEQKFKCLSVSDSADGQYAIIGVEHNDSIYNTADFGTALEYDDVTVFDKTPAIPANLQLSIRQINEGRSVQNIAVASWSRGIDAETFGFEVRYKLGDGSYFTQQLTDVLFEVGGIPAGSTLTFEVRAIGVPPVNRKSSWVVSQITAPTSGLDPDNSSQGFLPPTPQNVTVQATGNDQVILRWQTFGYAGNDDELIAIIRHASQVDGTGEWANSTLLRRVEARTDYAVLPLLEGEYLVKFEDTNGQRSLSAGSAIIDLPDPLPRLIIEQRREDQDVPPFQGEKVGSFYSEEYDGLVLDGDATIDEVPGSPLGGIDELTTLDFFGQQLLSGEYYFRHVLDLGGVFSVVFQRTLTSRGLYPKDTVDDRNELLDRWSDFDGDLPDDTTADIYFRTSDQATAQAGFLLEDSDSLLLEDGSLTELESDLNFGAWTPMESGRYTGRQFQFKVELTALHSDQTPIVDELGYTMQLESRTESSTTIASGAGAKAVTFASAFYQTPNIGITASNLSTGEYYEITSASRTGFTITFYNSSAAAVDRDFQYQAVGFGTEQS